MAMSILYPRIGFALSCPPRKDYGIFWPFLMNLKSEVVVAHRDFISGNKTQSKQQNKNAAYSRFFSRKHHFPDKKNAS